MQVLKNLSLFRAILFGAVHNIMLWVKIKIRNLNFLSYVDSQFPLSDPSPNYV